jgi:hypothetical protein
MKKDFEKEIKIYGTFTALIGLCLLILQIYFNYCIWTINSLSEIYLLILGPLLIIAGYGLIKLKSWARKMMVYIATVHLIAGIFYIFNFIKFFLPPPEIEDLSTNHNLLIKAILE